MLRRFLCRIIGHNYYVVNYLRTNMRKVSCKCCGKSWILHDNLKVALEYDHDFDKFN